MRRKNLNFGKRLKQGHDPSKHSHASWFEIQFNCERCRRARIVRTTQFSLPEGWLFTDKNGQFYCDQASCQEAGKSAGAHA